MKATDLRLGNYVHGPLGELCHITQLGYSLNSDFIGFEIVGKEGFGQNGCEPIPLTEDLLVKRLGAIKLDFKDFPSYNLKWMQINYIDGMWIEYVSRMEIKGLHHLQNIFYFRTGEELELKPVPTDEDAINAIKKQFNDNGFKTD